MKDKFQQKLQTYLYWKHEYNACFSGGKYKGIPVSQWDGMLMIEYLRRVYRQKTITVHSTYLDAAIRRKLRQYEGVQWFYDIPTKKARKPFDYYKKMFRHFVPNIA